MAVRSVRGTSGQNGEVRAWMEERAESGGFRVEPVPFAELDGWGFESGSGDLVHRSGRFFRIRGLRARVESADALQEWHQPIIDQPEVGLLGLVCQEIDGVLHFLMQAKMEPGNPEPVQLSPTVQATRSNLTGAHGGRGVRLLECFHSENHSEVLADVLQSEHGSWFLRKNNRNKVVEISPDRRVPEHPDFRWFSLGALGELLGLDGVVNMDSRSVLACLPAHTDENGSLHSDAEVRSWFAGQRFEQSVNAEPVGLSGLPDWVRERERVRHVGGRYFDVVGVAVRARSREVRGWSQPLLRPVAQGVVAFLARRFGGVPHLLVQARAEPGLVGGVELAPTVQCTPENYAHLPADRRPAFLDMVLPVVEESAPALYRAVHTEEGGRFRDAESLYAVVEAGPDLADPPPGYLWVTPGQLGSLLLHGQYVNVQARTLLACVNTGAVRL
ncbi:NDP-hexose 2,3-dehydratase family protein [Nocardiopsis kunsanensis]